MRSFFTIAALVAFLPAALSAPAELKKVSTVNGPKKEGSYIIALKPGASYETVITQVKGPTKIYKKFNSFAAELNEEELNKLLANPAVDIVEEDGISSISAVQDNAPWGLSRISQRGPVFGDPGELTFRYTYDDGAGRGVDVYVIDTGINTAHVEFGGRARWGATFGPYANRDGNGHGTHCAGTIGSNRYGVAKAVNLIAVKVLDDKGSGFNSDIIAGLEWILVQVRVTRRPSVVSMSLGGDANILMDRAVASLISNGIHVVVAAGNDSKDANSVSPARERSAITVAASDINDDFAWFSNYGGVVDIIAPGVSVISTWIGSNTATASLDGTSMATPHVAGISALYIAKNGNRTPPQLINALTAISVPNAISGVPSGTVNRLAQNTV